jgi:hypothetical protein
MNMRKHFGRHAHHLESLVRSHRPNQVAASSKETVRQLLSTPAQGLIAAAGLQLLVFLALVGFAIPAVAREGGHPAGYAVITGMALVSLAAALVVWIGACRMLKVRSYGLAIAASAVAMIAGPAALVGLPFGIWALVLLTRREVQAAFAKR